MDAVYPENCLKPITIQLANREVSFTISKINPCFLSWVLFLLVL